MFGYGCGVVFIWIVVKEIKSYKWLIAISLFVIFLPFAFRPIYLTTVRQSFQNPKPFWIPVVDLNQNKLIGLSVESYFEHWQKVSKLATKIPFKSSYVAYFYNLSKSKQLQLPDSLLMYYQPMNNGLFLEIGPDKSVAWIQSSADVWYEIGDMTMAEHATMLGQIFSDNRRSVRAIKRLAEINLINDDTVAAQKYLRLLEKTLFHCTWATQRNPYNQSENVKQRLEEKRKYCVKNDKIRGDDYTISLCNLLDANKNNRIALDYLLCDDLLAKNITAFYEDYVRYASRTQPKRIYAEALLIYMIVKKTTPEEFARFLIPMSVYKEFQDYTVHYEKGDMTYLQKKYEKTYWFYFHFVTMHKK